jgi:malonyl-CoA O-methyltransferase
MEPSPVAAAYDLWAASYDTVANATRDLDAAFFRAQSFAFADAAVVEIGCGTGKNTAWLVASGARVAAMDFSAAMLANARARVASAAVRFVEHDVVQPWPVDAGAADFVTCHLVLEHVADLGPVFVQAARALRPGGTFYVSEFHPYRQLLGKQARFTHASADTETRIPAYAHDVSDYVSAALASGFRVAALAEPRDADRDATAVPRLLVFTFVREATASALDQGAA